VLALAVAANEMNSVTSMRAAKTGAKLVTVSPYTTAAVVCRDAAGTGTGFGITGTGGNFATDNVFPCNLLAESVPSQFY
jgi:hypothetical protein